jgi:glutamine cyclotransferase
MKNLALVLVAALTFILNACSCVTSPTQPTEYTYKMVSTYPHDPNAFTEGLVFESGSLYEGTGLVGKSSLRRVDLNTGQVQQVKDLKSPYFGEGITIFKDNIFQLTWQSHVGFVYSKATFEETRQFSYSTEGWGFTNDGKRLIMSDGTARLYYLNPKTLEVTGFIDIQDAPSEIGNLRLNELEYVRGDIYANVWPTNYIMIISPSTGRVNGWIDLTGILDTQVGGQQVDVLNGIAYDARTNRLFVTGKFWPWLFEIKLTPVR